MNPDSPVANWHYYLSLIFIPPMLAIQNNTSQNHVMAREANRSNGHTMLDDLLQTRIAAIEAFSKSVSQSFSQRISILQDMANLSLVLLGGATSLTVFSDNKIKTHILFYLGEAGLLVVVIISFVIRLKILRARSKLTSALRKRENDLRNVIGLYKYHSTESHAEAEVRYNDIMSEKLDILPPPLMITIAILSVLVAIFITSIVLIGISILFKISV
jgi:hypothetical protein